MHACFVLKSGPSSFPSRSAQIGVADPICGVAPLARPGVASAARRTDLDTQVKLFHDCPIAEITIRQTRNRDTGDLAPFSLAVEVFGFEGSFLSVSVDLPAQAALNLTREHLIRMQTVIECERHTGMFARPQRSARSQFREGSTTVGPFTGPEHN